MQAGASSSTISPLTTSGFRFPSIEIPPSPLRMVRVWFDHEPGLWQLRRIWGEAVASPAFHRRPEPPTHEGIEAQHGLGRPIPGAIANAAVGQFAHRRFVLIPVSIEWTLLKGRMIFGRSRYGV
jgi:hypothetical protein